jgi:hypothetical protein
MKKEVRFNLISKDITEDDINKICNHLENNALGVIEICPLDIFSCKYVKSKNYIVAKVRIPKDASLFFKDNEFNAYLKVEIEEYLKENFGLEVKKGIHRKMKD